MLLLFRLCLCPVTVHYFFCITRLIFAWVATSACSSCLHSAVLLVSITILLIPHFAFQYSGAAAEISFYNLWYPLITSHCTNTIAWGFCILSLLRYQKQRLGGTMWRWQQWWLQIAFDSISGHVQRQMVSCLSNTQPAQEKEMVILIPVCVP